MKALKAPESAETVKADACRVASVKQGTDAIIFLQSLRGITEDRDNAEGCWLAMSDQDKALTMASYNLCLHAKIVAEEASQEAFPA